MKTNIITILLLLATICNCSCQSDTEHLLNGIASMNIKTNRTKEYIKNNTYINFDIRQLNKEISLSTSSRSNRIDTTNISMAKAAIYRFYKHVKVINYQYVCDIKSGKVINVSDEIFNAFLSNMEEINKDIEKKREKGEEVIISIPDKDYLNSLLE